MQGMRWAPFDLMISYFIWYVCLYLGAFEANEMSENEEMRWAPFNIPEITKIVLGLGRRHEFIFHFLFNQRWAPFETN